MILIQNPYRIVHQIKQNYKQVLKDNEDDADEEAVPLACRRRSSSATLNRTESHGVREVNEPRT